eukprot:CAMPEP_0204062606 /NCGR_PEP_ID=MMETSP0360-20130528/144686_1 /ASSEMBLY_ACC=CAM_ASM_000342 /TAXON_ID=268821 /ORGANISM="Scrippsiella Hangoei, Strain SHTV-5" /LENGTH=167 /DNA_ID=CAMNT_0051010409 /DNA_START=55 /DNA_END=555 /DNA_ORIENTATION=-
MPCMGLSIDICCLQAPPLGVWPWLPPLPPPPAASAVGDTAPPQVLLFVCVMGMMGLNSLAPTLNINDDAFGVSPAAASAAPAPPPDVDDVAVDGVMGTNSAASVENLKAELMSPDFEGPCSSSDEAVVEAISRCAFAGTAAATGASSAAVAGGAEELAAGALLDGAA